MNNREKSILAIDVGTKRIGLAIASVVSRLPSVLPTIANNEDAFTKIKEIITDKSVNTIVVGIPRSLEGNDTQQTTYTRDWVKQMQSQISIPVVFQDEAGTSVKATEFLRLTKKKFEKPDIDGLAASYILDDFLATRTNA